MSYNNDSRYDIVDCSIKSFRLKLWPSKSNDSLILKLNNTSIEVKWVELYLVELFNAIDIYGSIFSYSLCGTVRIKWRKTISTILFDFLD